MRNALLMLVMMGLFYTTLTGTLHDLTVADCNQGVAAACRELNK